MPRVDWYRWNVGPIVMALGVSDDGKLVVDMSMPEAVEITSVKGEYFEVIHQPIGVGKQLRMILKPIENEYIKRNNRGRALPGQLSLSGDTPIKKADDHED